jgi:hypothetical protein
MQRGSVAIENNFTAKFSINGTEAGKKELTANSPVSLVREKVEHPGACAAQTACYDRLSKEGKKDGAVYYENGAEDLSADAEYPAHRGGVIISREFYELDDIREEHPLTTLTQARITRRRSW